MDTNMITDKKKYGYTLINSTYQKDPLNNNFKNIVKSRKVLLKTNSKIKSILSLKIIPEIISTNLIFTPNCNNITNCEGLKSSKHQIGIYGTINQTIYYEDYNSTTMESISEIIPFSAFVPLDNNISLNNTPKINIDVDYVHVDIKSPNCLFERISLLIDVS